MLRRPVKSAPNKFKSLFTIIKVVTANVLLILIIIPDQEKEKVIIFAERNQSVYLFLLNICE